MREKYRKIPLKWQIFWIFNVKNPGKIAENPQIRENLPIKQWFSYEIITFGAKNRQIFSKFPLFSRWNVFKRKFPPKNCTLYRNSNLSIDFLLLSQIWAFSVCFCAINRLKNCLCHHIPHINKSFFPLKLMFQNRSNILSPHQIQTFHLQNIVFREKKVAFFQSI